jgi:hypothetical protein
MIDNVCIDQVGKLSSAEIVRQKNEKAIAYHTKDGIFCPLFVQQTLHGSFKLNNNKKDCGRI